MTKTNLISKCMHAVERVTLVFLFLALFFFILAVLFTGCSGTTDGGIEPGDGIFIIDGTWRPTGSPDSLGSASSIAEPRVFFYAAKKANVVWTYPTEGYGMSSNAFNGASWTGYVEREYTDHSPEPRIFSNGFNVSFAVWRRYDECDTVYYARIDETVWGETVILSVECGGGGDGLQDIAFQIGEAEVAFAVWQENGGDVYASRYESGWDSPTAISDNGGDDPRVAVDEAGNAMVIWRDLGTLDLRGNRYTGGSWRSEANQYEISSNDVRISGEKIEADLAAGLGGRFAAVWRATDNKIYASLFDGSWSSETVISTSAWNEDPHVTFTPNGDVVAVWDDGDYVWAASFPAGAEWPGGWKGPWQISPIAGEGWYGTEIAADPGGNVFIVWGGDYIYARRYPAGTDWATWAASDDDLTILDPSGLSEPHVAVDANGRAIVVWQRDSGIYSKRYFE